MIVNVARMWNCDLVQLQFFDFLAGMPTHSVWMRLDELFADGRATVYGDGPPESQPVTTAPAARACSAAAEAPAPAIPTTWMRSPRRMGRARRAGGIESNASQTAARIAILMPR